MALLVERLLVATYANYHEGADVEGFGGKPGGRAGATRGLDRPLDPFRFGAYRDGGPDTESGAASTNPFIRSALSLGSENNPATS